MKYLWNIIKTTSSLWRVYIFVGIVSVFVALLNMAIPAMTGRAIDEIRLGTESDLSILVGIAFLIFLADLIITFISNIGGYWGDQMQARLYKLLGDKYYEHLLSLPQKYYDAELSGKLINRLNRSIAQISNFMQMMSNNFLQFIFSTIFALAIVAFYSWQVALLLFALYPIFIWMTVKSSGKWIDYQHQKNEQADIASGRFSEAINQIKVVKSFIQEKRELKFFNKHMQRAVKINEPQSKHWHKKDIERRLLLNFVFFLVYVFIFIQGAKGQFSPGQTVALILYAMQIRIPIFTISFLVDNTQRAVADSKDYFEVMDVSPEIKDNKDAKEISVKTGKIELKKVNFSYDKNQPIIKNISFTIDENSKVALVGESGEGKTTLTNLLMRLYEPESGEILIDGYNINDVTQKSLRRNIGVVFQDPSLFSGTIKENIGYANLAATDDEIISAAKAANADGFINKFEKGYETEIGERGLKLSGGQKQRIAIARALLKNAPILVLDEATSSLDSKSEKLVQEALNNLMKNRTTIIIAHRLSTIQNVDKIITLKNGKVDEVGSPKELSKTSGIYAQLLQLQSAKKSEKSQKKLRSFEISV